MGFGILFIFGIIVVFIVITSTVATDGEKGEAAKGHFIYGGIYLTGGKIFFLLNLISAAVTTNAQENWVSSTHHYSLEIPDNFIQLSAIGSNVDFKAGNGKGSVVVVVKALPDEYKNLGIWDIMGDLSTYESEWEAGAQEYFESPDFLKYGKTKIDGQDTFWYDYTVNNPKDYINIKHRKKVKSILLP